MTYPYPDHQQEAATPPPKKGLPTWAWILIIVFVIGPVGLVGLSIVAAIAIPSLMVARMEADVQKATSDIIAIHDAVETYAQVNRGQYPQSLEELVRPDDTGATYLSSPTVPSDPWGRAYGYDVGGPGSLPRIYTLGFDGAPGGTDFNADIDNYGLLGFR